MNEQRQQAYFNLIQSLLNCRTNDEIQEILTANQELMDVGFLQTIEAKAAIFSQQGDENTANWLQGLAMQLGEGLNLDTTVDLQSLGEEEKQAYLQFLRQVIQATVESKCDKQVVYPLLAKNTDKLDRVLAKILHRWVTNILREAEADVAESIARDIGNFSGCSAIAQIFWTNRSAKAVNFYFSIKIYLNHCKSLIVALELCFIFVTNNQYYP